DVREQVPGADERSSCPAVRAPESSWLTSAQNVDATQVVDSTINAYDSPSRRRHRPGLFVAPPGAKRLRARRGQLLHRRLERDDLSAPAVLPDDGTRREPGIHRCHRRRGGIDRVAAQADQWLVVGPYPAT